MENLGEEVNSLRMEEAQPAKAMDVGPMDDGGLGRFRPEMRLKSRIRVLLSSMKWLRCSC